MKTKGSIGIEMLVPVFLLVFSIIVIFAGIEWGVNTLSLMSKEKQVTQMDAELLGITDLYIKPALKFAMQDTIRDLALHGGLSSEILNNKKLFVLSGTSDADKAGDETAIESDFRNGNLEFPVIESPMKVEGNILYWAYMKDEGTNIRTIPYSYEQVLWTLDTDNPVLELYNSYIVLISEVNGTVKQYDWTYDLGSSSWVYEAEPSKIYKGPVVVSGNTRIKLEIEGKDAADVEGAHDITSAFEPLFPKITYPGDALAQRSVYPRFTDIMMSDRLNTFRSDYGSSKAAIGSELSLGTWNSFFVPTKYSRDKILAFYGGNSIAVATQSVEMENTDPVKSVLDNRYWKLYGIAENFLNKVTSDSFLRDDLSMNAFYSEKYAVTALFRNISPKTCSEEWQDACGGQQKDNIYDSGIDDCHDDANSHTDSDLYVQEITLDSGSYELGETIGVDVDIVCPPGEYFVWTVAYSITEEEWNFNENGVNLCPAGGTKRISVSFTMDLAYTTGPQHIRASVGKEDEDAAGDTCMTGDSADNDEMTLYHLDAVPESETYSDSVSDSCFDGDTGCRFLGCNEKYAGTPPVLKPKDDDDKFATLKAKKAGVYTSKSIEFKVADNFNKNYRDRYIDKKLVPFILDGMTEDDLASNITAAEEVYITFNYGSDTTLGCSQREDVITDIRVTIEGSPGIIGRINPDLEGTDCEDFYKKQKIVLDKTAIAGKIRDNGSVRLQLAVYVDGVGENMPSQMYAEQNPRIYIYDHLVKGAYPSRMIDINPVYETGSLEPSMNYGFEEAKGIAVDNKGYIYIINADEHRLYRYNRYGVFKGYMDLPDLSPQGIDIDTATGNIYITFYDGKNITRYDSFFDSRDFAPDPGIPPRPVQMCTGFAASHPTDVAFYKGHLFAVFDDSRLDYCTPQSNSWFIGSLPDVSGGDKITAISVDSAEDKLYAKVIKPVIDPVTLSTIYYRYYYVYDLRNFADDPTTASITRIDDETLPIDFSLSKFDIYSPKKGESTQAYFLKKTGRKPATHALLDDFRLNIDFSNTLVVDVESIDNVESMTDRIEYYEDGCGSVTENNDCDKLWEEYAISEYYKDVYRFNPDADCDSLNSGTGGVDLKTLAKLKTLLGLSQSEDIPCSKTIDSVKIKSYPGPHMRLKVNNKVIEPRIIDAVRELNRVYNARGIYIDVDYDIHSDFGSDWYSNDFVDVVDSYSSGSIKLGGYPCSCMGRTKTCGDGHGPANYIYKTSSWCEYKYGAVYSFNITIEDREKKIWDPVLHRMATMKFKYGFEWSVLDNSIEQIYIADERDMSAYISGNNAYAFCSGSYSPNSCHQQDGIANYYDKQNDFGECPGRAGESVDYNELHCQDDDYGICRGPLHTHCSSCGEGCTSCYSHRHYSCYRYNDPYSCSAKRSIAIADVNHYITCTGTPEVIVPQTPAEICNPLDVVPCEDPGDDVCCEDPDSVDHDNMTLNIKASNHAADPAADPVDIVYDISSLKTSCVNTIFNPSVLSPLMPVGCNCGPVPDLFTVGESGNIQNMIVTVNRSFDGTLFIDKVAGCP